MIKFIAWRLIQFPIVMAVIYICTYLLAWVAPGTPFGNNERKLDPEVQRRLMQQFHADSPLTFLTHYPWQIIRHGDFGPSMLYLGWSVGDVMRDSLKVSITLGMYGLTIALFFGCWLGAVSAVRRGGVINFVSIITTLVGVSLPGFVAAGILLAIFSDRLGWFPGSGWKDLRHLFLPAVTLSLAPMAYIAQLTRVSMLDVLGEDYIRTARAKGLSRSTVIWRHCFRNAILPVFSYLGPAAAAALTGSFVIEYVFNIPGLGQHFVNGVKNRDQTLILGTVMVYSFFLLALNLLVDIGYAFIDPRIDVSQ